MPHLIRLNTWQLRRVVKRLGAEPTLSIFIDSFNFTSNPLERILNFIKSELQKINHELNDPYISKQLRELPLLRGFFSIRGFRSLAYLANPRAAYAFHSNLPIPSMVCYQTPPYLKPLAAQTFQYPITGIVALSELTTRFFTWELGSLREEYQAELGNARLSLEDRSLALKVATITRQKKWDLVVLVGENSLIENFLNDEPTFTTSHRLMGRLYEDWATRSFEEIRKKIWDLLTDYNLSRQRFHLERLAQQPSTASPYEILHGLKQGSVVKILLRHNRGPSAIEEKQVLDQIVATAIEKEVEIMFVQGSEYIKVRTTGHVAALWQH